MRKFLEQQSSSRVRAYDTIGEMSEQNLAITPSEMNQMTQRGIPVSSSVLSPELFDSGHEIGINTPLSVFERRGFDFSDASVYEQNCRNRVSSYAQSLKSE